MLLSRRCFLIKLRQTKLAAVVKHYAEAIGKLFTGNCDAFFGEILYCARMIGNGLYG